MAPTLLSSTTMIASLSFAPPQQLSASRFNGGLRASPLPSNKLRARAPVLRAAPSKGRPLKVSCESTLEKVQEIIAGQLSVDLASVQPETKFSELGADSLDTVEIVMSIEEKFGVSISEETAEKISTVQQVADLIEKQKVAS